MQRLRKTGNYSGSKSGFAALVVVLCVALVATVGVAVAAFSQDLKINGVATVQHTSWDVHFANLQPAQFKGHAEEITAPQILDEGTRIGDYNVSLLSAGDAVTYQFDVENAGDLNAKIAAISIYTNDALTCSTTSDTAATDPANICKHLNYTLAYADDSAVQINDVLASGATRSMKLTLELDSSMSTDELPTEDISVSGLGVTISYVQN